MALYEGWLANRETSLAGHQSPVLVGTLSQDGRHAVTASSDGEVRAWDLSGHTPTFEVKHLTKGRIPATAAYGPSGPRIISIEDQYDLFSEGFERQPTGQTFVEDPFAEASSPQELSVEGVILFARKRRHSGIGYRTPAHAEMLIKAAA